MIIEKFKEEIAKLGLEVDAQQLALLMIYKNSLQETNKKFNLTAVDDDQGIFFRHFLDSLSLAKALDLTKINTLADIGTGAGLPGIPLKILFPHLTLTLVESIGKKAGFLEEITGKLGLNSVKIVQNRLENMGKEHKYDLITARAVAKLPILMEICLPYVKNGGRFVAYKQENIEIEPESAENIARILGAKPEKTEKVEIFDGNAYVTRSLFMLRKLKDSPAQYPRRMSLIIKNPLR
jgi:16S rRNA (guanine527-N7)-methyltransferase